MNLLTLKLVFLQEYAVYNIAANTVGIFRNFGGESDAPLGSL